MNDNDYDAMIGEQRRMKDLKERGLCLSCGSRPSNPELGPYVCLDCYKEFPEGCQANNCINSSVGYWKDAQFCAVHLIDIIHEAYQQYLELKSELEESRKEFEDLVRDVNFDPRNTEKPPNEYTEQEEKLVNLYAKVCNLQLDLDWLKDDIDKAMDGVDQAFPDNYSTPI